MAARLLGWLCLAALMPACESPTEDLSGSRPRDAGVGDAGRVPGSIFDPAAELEPTRTVSVFEPSDSNPNEQLQGSAFQLVWTGSKYLLFWLQNRSGRLELLSRTIDPAADLAQSSIQTVVASDDAPELNERPYALCREDRCAVFYIEESAIGVVFTDLEGAPITGPAEVLRIDNLRLAKVGFGVWGDGYRFLLHRLTEANLSVYRTRADGAVELGYPRVLANVFSGEGNAAFGGLVPVASGWAMLWSDRVPARDHDVLLTELSPDFERAIDRRTLFRGRGTASFLGPDDDPRVVLFVDVAGVVLHRVGGSTEPERIVEDEYTNISAFHDPEGASRIALVYTTGELSANTANPTGVAFRSYDYDTRATSEPLSLAEGPGCVERVDAVLAGDRAGVAWVTGCSTRRLWFVELRAFTSPD